MRRRRVLFGAVWLTCGAVLASSIDGVVFLDFDRDGIRDLDEPPLVFGGADGGLGVSFACKSLPQGRFRAGNAAVDPISGELAIGVPQRPGELLSSCLVGIDGSTTLEALRLRVSGAAATVVDVAPGTLETVELAVIFQDVGMSGRVWHDDDLDGVYEPEQGEVGVADVVITNKCTGGGLGNLEAEAVTEGDGTYFFGLEMNADSFNKCNLRLSGDQEPLEGLEATTPTKITVWEVLAGDSLFQLDFGVGPASSGALGATVAAARVEE